MRVCIVSTGHDARDDRLYFKEARSLAKEHDLTLMAPSTRTAPAEGEERISFVRLNCKPTRVSRALMALRLVVLLPRGEYDVIHLSDNETLPLGPLLAWRCNAKVVCDIWEANYEMILGEAAKPAFTRRVAACLFRSIEGWAARRCSLVLAADNAIAESLGPLVKAVVIFNFPILSVLAAPQEVVDGLQEKLRGAQCVVYHGSMAEERGVLAAVEAMQHVRGGHPDAKLLLIGRMPDSLDAEIRCLVDRLDLGPTVEIVGWVDHAEVGKYLAVSSIGLVPFARTRKFEKNIPQKIFEYWAAGLPVVATDLTPIRNFVEQCDGGILIAGNEPTLLAEAICSLLDSPEVARGMGLRGRAMVESSWRWERMETVLLNSYRALSGREL